MAVLLQGRDLAKHFGAQTLFEGVSLNIDEGERHGFIGANGAGKSTLLKILAGLDSADAGEVAPRKGLRLAYVPQEPEFPAGKTVGELLDAAAHEPALAPVIMGQAGFTDADAMPETLSGGWRKRLALALALVREPDVLLLDEPTNHLDLAGIEWLEATLVAAPFSCLFVTHDRYFLENVATHVLEIARSWPGGLFKVEGPYSTFLEKREQAIEAREKRREALAAVVRREVEWLRRGAKARTRKSKARIGDAERKIDDLADMEQRARTSVAAIDFTGSDRKTKRLLEAAKIGAHIGDRPLFNDLSFVLGPNFKLGLAGPNGAGKSTLLRILDGTLPPSTGAIRRADLLRVVHFEQHRQQVDPQIPLKRALAPEGDSVIYQGRPIHVNAWASRFLFRAEQLMQPVSSLSGGERARLHIARLMLEPADLLLLDEPTNDLDIPTLEVLEQSLLEFPGALVLVTHDRYLMDRVAGAVLGIDGDGDAGLYANLAQWEDDLDRKAAGKRAAAVAAASTSGRESSSKKRLGYIEQREWDAMEGKILLAETRLAERQTEMHDPAVTADPVRLKEVYASVTAAQAEVDQLYARWSELEAKRG